MKAGPQVIVFRTGGTANFAWRRSLPMSMSDAQEALQAEYRAGRMASMIISERLSLAIGLPETYEYR